MKVKLALISVTDKKKLKNLLRNLKKFKITILSSDGTYAAIKKLGFDCLKISDYTGSPEILNGRVKTLHPKIHAGILSKKNHKKELIKFDYNKIDLVICNFYPFEKILEKTNSKTKIIENIDIGGPTMVRGAAKNYSDTTVITDINQYDSLISELNINKGSTTLAFREKMSEEAFSLTAYYDAVISNYLNNLSKNYFPKKKVFYANLIEKLRYGENPHQVAALYSKINDENLVQINGKKLSYNNYSDMFTAISISNSFKNNYGTVIVKHSNPCGVSMNNDKLDSFKNAYYCDPLSSYGGVVAFNFKINKKLAIEIKKKFFELVVSKGIDGDALDILKKKKNLRILDSSNLLEKGNLQYTSKFNSLLIQSTDTKNFEMKDFKIVSKAKPNTKILKKLMFAFNICRFVKSNAIVLSQNNSTIGIGSGQPSRLDSCEIAIKKMKQNRKYFKNEDEIVAASDAFFPFTDGIESLVQAGVTAIIQPYGSIRDKEIIKYANQTNTVLVFSKTRHFLH